MHSTINVCCKVNEREKLVVLGLGLNILKTTELRVQLSVSYQPLKSCTRVLKTDSFFVHLIRMHPS